jgi:hypothetical protein
VDNIHGNRYLGSAFRPNFDHVLAPDLLIGSDGFLSLAYLFHPLQDMNAACVSFSAADGIVHYDFTVKSVALSNKYVEVKHSEKILVSGV